MTVTGDFGCRPTSYGLTALEDRFEILKEIGDGSFGSVALARVRAKGASVARHNSMVRLLSLGRLVMTAPADVLFRSRSRP